ncbi:MAG: FAD-dependent oxidoreductase [Burkholderiales bacterium]|nr:NAD(P)/FAD-dependent oxidoreductase [Burkholderiales bacterium]MBZ0248257.1 FAD-dependent oxidoreductase [Burkholderiales bacterium]MCL4688019.1 FAD-dependent oxidoreductase [Burkholderiales bacterium]
MRHVILGNGPAGVVAAEALRKLSPPDTVTLVGDEPGPPYSRMAIPYLLMGDIDEQGTWLRKEPGHFERMGIALKEGRAAAVDASKREVRLESGEVLAWDRLLVATGSRPNRPPIPGIDLPGVHPCWTLADARAIAARVRKGSRVVQMGAGFIGCIILEALASRGVELVVVEMGDRMVPRMMPPRASEMIRAWCEREGVHVVTGARVAAIEQAGSALSVKLTDGQAWAADLVISATGVTPNTAFLEGSGVACDGGVLVDERMESSVKGIFAAGDVSRAPEFDTDRKTAYAIQPTAVEQARVAALNMAGREATSPGALAMNVLDTLGLVSVSFGQWHGVPHAQGGSWVEEMDRDRFRYLRLEFRDDRLIGATSLGHTEHAGVIRGLIQGRVRLGGWREKLLANPSRLMEAYLACAQAAS